MGFFLSLVSAVPAAAAAPAAVNANKNQTKIFRNKKIDQTNNFQPSVMAIHIPRAAATP
jgi:hypothetical protein